MWFECKCGHRIHDISDAHHYKAHIIPDKQWHPLWDAVDDAIENSGPSSKDKERACMELRSKVYGRQSVYQCPVCGRIYFALGNGEMVCFKPELDSTSKKLFDTD